MDTKKVDLMLRTMFAPLSTLEFFEGDVLEEYLESIKEGDFLDEYEKKIKAIRKIVHKREKLHNLDEIDMYMTRHYDPYELRKEKNIMDFYGKFLEKAARSFLSHRNGRICFKYWSGENEDMVKPYGGLDKIHLWHSLNRIICTDVLVCKYLISNGLKNPSYLDGYYHQIAMEDLQLEGILQKGMSENHIHISAGTNFALSWRELMDIENSKNREDMKKKMNMFAKGDKLTRHIANAGVIRFLMSIYIRNSESGQEANWTEFCEYTADCEGNYFHLITDLLRRFESGECGIEESLCKSLYQSLKIKVSGERDYIEELFEMELRKGVKLNTFTETVFIFKALLHMENNPDDNCFKKSFYQYLRIKNEVFQFMVQHNQIKGLENFKEYFDASTYVAFGEDRSFWDEVLKNQFSDPNLKKIEIRLGISKDESENKIKRSVLKKIKAILESYQKIINERMGTGYCLEDCDYKEEKIYENVPLLGIVFHFIKRKDSKIESKCWIDGGQNHYYEKQQKLYMRQASVLKNILKEVPLLSKFLVGIDAASSENDTEPWVFAPVYNMIRDGADDFLDSSFRKTQTLGFTFHAGEDFRHITTGLRRIDEVIHKFKYHAGDRIGHAIALGIDVDRWAKDNPVVIMPRLEYLENLLWVWGLCKDRRLSTSIDEGYLERKILDLSREIYIRTEGITVYDLWRAYQDKFKKFKAEEYLLEKKDINKCKGLNGNIEEDYLFDGGVFCCETAHRNTYVWNSDKLRCAYHCKVFLRRMLKPIAVEVKDIDRDIIKAIQLCVLKKVSQEGIVVETNPSSNRAIGEIENIFKHYIHRLNGDSDDENHIRNSVIVTINSDDPSVFQTSIGSEFAYIFYSLVDRKYSKKYVLEWIDRVREDGMRTSFIRERSLKHMRKELDLVLKKVSEILK